MRSLFLKIFLIFWVTMVVVGAVLIYTWGIQPEVIVSRWRGATSDAVALYAQSAAEELDRYGMVALNNYFQRLDASSHIRAALFDENGNLIAGRASKSMRDLAPHAGLGGEPAFTIQGSSAMAAQRTTGPSGRVYIMVGEMPRGPVGTVRRLARAQIEQWAAAILLSGLICYLLTLYLTRPILRLRQATHELSAGDLSARAPAELERRRDELGELVSDFNQMANRIEQLMISQRQLISDISHELRSPLARLNVALGLARQRAGEEASSALDRIEREAERLNEMIGKLLSLARMQGAAGPPDKSHVRLDEIVKEVAEDAEFEAQERSCAVRMVGNIKCTAEGSPELLRSAVENVVRNAVRYTASGSEIEITLANHDSTAEITVRDHGPGVPDSELQNLFRPFYRVGNARERDTGGAGLGLAIADRAVRLHGGTVAAANAPGGGLVVKIRVPAQCG
ncbi:MAG TPA: ATP-binding protein [Terriglobales bacterium]|nr:ATP-binding protein [Terriglobales bacterium]